MLDSGTIDEAELHKLSKKDFSSFVFDKHLYKPIVFKDRGETALSIKPVELNDGERDFVEDLGIYIKRTTTQHKDSEIYLLRNQSKTGLGFFTEGNFYPDFIMWIINGDKQYISFIDPKGIRNSNPKSDPKINLALTIKDVENKLGDMNTILNSFILSNTSLSVLNVLHTGLTYEYFEDKNVLFQNDRKSSYIDMMFDKVLN